MICGRVDLPPELFCDGFLLTLNFIRTEKNFLLFVSSSPQPEAWIQMKLQGILTFEETISGIRRSTVFSWSLSDPSNQSAILRSCWWGEWMIGYSWNHGFHGDVNPVSRWWLQLRIPGSPQRFRHCLATQLCKLGGMTHTHRDTPRHTHTHTHTHTHIISICTHISMFSGVPTPLFRGSTRTRAGGSGGPPPKNFFI